MSYSEYVLVGTTAHGISEGSSSILTSSASSEFIEQDSRLLDSSASAQHYSVHPSTLPTNAVKLLQLFIEVRLSHTCGILFNIGWTERFGICSSTNATGNGKNNEKAKQKA